jgi:hypothetical protein
VQAPVIHQQKPKRESTKQQQLAKARPNTNVTTPLHIMLARTKDLHHKMMRERLNLRATNKARPGVSEARRLGERLRNGVKLNPLVILAHRM